MNLEKVKKVKQSKVFTVLDAIFVALIVAVIGLSAWLIYGESKQSVTIVAPDYKRSFPLDRDAVVKLDHLTVHIRSGKVWVTDADCSDKICERTGVISYAGQSIVCLPHGITVTIDGNGDLAWDLGG